MIFLTVGSQIRFDRLVQAVDQWCGQTGRTDVFGQIANVGTDGYQPRNFEWTSFLELSNLNQIIRDSELIIAHAGMGSIISALTMGKRIVIMPRRAALMETRNDHQHATMMRFASRPLIYAAADEIELPAVMEMALGDKSQDESVTLSPFASTELIFNLKRFISYGTTETETEVPHEIPDFICKDGRK